MGFSEMCWPTLTYLILSVIMIFFTIIVTFTVLIKSGLGTFLTYLSFFITIAVWCIQVYVWCKVLNVLCSNDHEGFAWLIWLGLPLLNFAVISLIYMLGSLEILFSSTGSTALSSALATTVTNSQVVSTATTAPSAQTLYYT